MDIRKGCNNPMISYVYDGRGCCLSVCLSWTLSWEGTEREGARVWREWEI